MAWTIHHTFVGHPCVRPNVAPPTRGPKLKRPRSCDSRDHQGAIIGLGDAVTSLLARRGIETDAVGSAPPFLWCLGGPSLYRRDAKSGSRVPIEEAITDDTCVDLNLWICAPHEQLSVDLFPYDLVASAGGTGPTNPLTSAPVVLAEAWSDARAVFLAELETWLDDVLVLPG